MAPLTLLAAACALILAIYAVLLRYVVAELNMADFAMFDCSIRSFVQGRDMYLSCTTESVVLGRLAPASVGNLNPPHAHLPWLPLALVQPVTALAIWSAVGLLALAASAWMIVGASGLRLSAARLLGLAVAVLVFAPTGAVILGGESTFLLLLPFTLVWLAARRGRWVLAGALLGVTISVKPFLLVFLPYLLLRRRLRALGASIAASAFSLAVGLGVFGPAAYLSWLRTLAGVSWSCQEYNASLLGVFSRMLTSNVCGPSPLDLPWLVGPAWLATSALVGAATLVAVACPKRDSVDRSFAVLILAALLMSPLGWPYYLLLAVGPFVSWLSARHSLGRWEQAVLLGVSPCLVGPFTLGTLLVLPSAVAGGLQAWAVVGLWVVVAADGLAATMPRYPAAIGNRTSTAWRGSRRLVRSGLRRLLSLA